MIERETWKQKQREVEPSSLKQFLGDDKGFFCDPIEV